MRKYLFILLCSLPFLSFAQDTKDDSKYLGNVVPLIDGKVRFAKEINAPGMSSDAIYTAMQSWAESRFATNGKNNWGKVFADKEKGLIVCRGEEFLVFTDKALSLDRSRANFRFTIECLPGKCKLDMTNIVYFYPEGDKPERIVAEEWITDENSMNKKRTRLYRNTGKFRIKTVDLAEELFKGATNALGSKVLTGGNVAPTAVVTPAVVPAVSFAPAEVVATGNQSEAPAGYRSISPDRIPGNIIKQLSESWSLITAGNDAAFNMMTASWGGLGFLYNKPVSFCFINPARHTYQLMEKGDYYTISFYTEAYRDALNYCGSNSGKDTDKVAGSGLTPITLPGGSKAFAEAWLIIECKKLVSQHIANEGMADEKLKQDWAGKPTHKMYIGEVVNVWVK